MSDYKAPKPKDLERVEVNPDQHKKDVLKHLGVNLDNPSERRYAGSINFAAFVMIYFPHYFYLVPAKFHIILINILQDFSAEAVEVIGFRGSAKSAYCSLAYPIWCAVYKFFKFPIIINDTDAQVRLNMRNIRNEFEDNVYLQEDFSSLFKDKDSKWSETELQLSNGVLIMGRSRGQKIRGILWPG